MGVVNPKDKKLRAIKLINETVLGGKTIKQASKEMGISEDTAQKTMQWARTANLFVDYENRLYDELLPLAHEAIKLALQDGDAQVALKIMDNVGLGAQRLKQTKAMEESTEGLYGEIARLRTGNIIDVSQRQLGSGDSGSEQLETLDATGAEVDFVPGGLQERTVYGVEEITETKSETGSEIIVETNSNTRNTE